MAASREALARGRSATMSFQERVEEAARREVQPGEELLVCVGTRMTLLPCSLARFLPGQTWVTPHPSVIGLTNRRLFALQFVGLSGHYAEQSGACRRWQAKCELIRLLGQTMLQIEFPHADRCRFYVYERFRIQAETLVRDLTATQAHLYPWPGRDDAT
jgi:hypothetical protein